MMLLLQRVCYRMTALNREALLALRKDFFEKPEKAKLQPYMVPENVHQLAPLVAQSPIKPNAKVELLNKLSELASIDNDGGVRTTAYIKYQLSLNHLKQRNVFFANECIEQALQVMTLLQSKPLPSQLANLYHHKAQILLSNKQHIKVAQNLLKTAVSLYQQEVKQSPDNEAIVLQLIFCYTRLAWVFIKHGDFLGAEKWVELGDKLWNQPMFEEKMKQINQSKQGEKNVFLPKSYVVLEQMRCLVLYKSNTGKEVLSNKCKEMMANEMVDPYSRLWFVVLARANKISGCDKAKKAIVEKHFSHLKPEQIRNYVKNLKQAIGIKKQADDEQK